MPNELISSAFSCTENLEPQILHHFCRITTIRARWAGVAAANKHTVAVTDAGAVYSWGDNSQGQLGYGTTDSAANANPRIVEAMKVR